MSIPYIRCNTKRTLFYAPCLCEQNKTLNLLYNPYPKEDTKGAICIIAYLKEETKGAVCSIYSNSQEDTKSTTTL